MNITTLEGASLQDILTVFNHSFSDYVVPVELFMDQLQEKVIAEQIDLSISVGAYVGGEFVGFVLHASRMLDGKKTFYNGGTGVIPTARGQGLTTKMYDFILPILKERGYQQGRLEVIFGNDAAIKSYERVGYRINRELPCFRGEVAAQAHHPGLQLTEVSTPDWPVLQSFKDWGPTWQNHSETLNRLPNAVRTVMASKAEELLAFVTYDSRNNRIKQFAVHPNHRKAGIASQLFYELFQGDSVSITNVDGNSLPTIAFLKKVGLAQFLLQYEMAIDL